MTYCFVTGDQTLLIVQAFDCTAPDSKKADVIKHRVASEIREAAGAGD